MPRPALSTPLHFHPSPGQYSPSIFLTSFPGVPDSGSFCSSSPPNLCIHILVIPQACFSFFLAAPPNPQAFSKHLTISSTQFVSVLLSIVCLCIALSTELDLQIGGQQPLLSVTHRAGAMKGSEPLGRGPFFIPKFLIKT